MFLCLFYVRSAGAAGIGYTCCSFQGNEIVFSITSLYLRVSICIDLFLKYVII